MNPMLAQCWANVADGGTRFNQHWVNVSITCIHKAKKTQDFHPMSVKCWSTICDAGPTFNQYWANISCLMVVAGYFTAGPDSSFDPGRGLKLRGTGFESRPSRMFVIEFVHIQCSKLLKGLECAVYYKLPFESFNKSSDFRFPSVEILP